MSQIDIFGMEPPQEREYMHVLPVSVLDIVPQKRRASGGHNSNSSRAEYSPFPLEVCDLCYQLFLRDSEHVLDPFAGWGERHSKALEWEKQYTGFDVSIDSVMAAKDRFGVDNVLADSRTVDLPQGCDGLLTCPPYFDLEVYGGESGLDKLASWADFIDDYRAILERFYDALECGATICIMVGDWRSNGVYYDLEYQTNKIMSDMGATPFDKVIVSRKNTSKIKVMVPQAVRMGYTVHVHEVLLVFKKP